MTRGGWANGRHVWRAVAALAFVVSSTLPSPAMPIAGAPPASHSVAASRGTVAVLAQSATPTIGPTGSPLPTPGPIVPRSNPLGKVGIAAMVVVAAAGLWIYRVIRKGL